MTREQLLREIKGHGVGFLKSPDSIQRRITALAEIEFVAQEAREALESELDNLDETEKITPETCPICQGRLLPKLRIGRHSCNLCGNTSE